MQAGCYKQSMLKFIRSFVNCLAAVFLLAGTTHAATTFYSDRASFDAASGSLSGFESFETFFSASTVDFGSFTVAETGDIGNLVEQTSFNSTDGTHSLGVVPTDLPISSTIIFTFDTPINAFGFDITNQSVGGFNVFVGGDVSDSIPIFTANTFEFWGVVDTVTSFSTLTFSPNANTGELMIDSVSYGAVPEPSSTALLGLGGLALLLRRRR
jgi:hypothetical protein